MKKSQRQKAIYLYDLTYRKHPEEASLYGQKVDSWPPGFGGMGVGQGKAIWWEQAFFGDDGNVLILTE